MKLFRSICTWLGKNSRRPEGKKPAWFVRMFEENLIISDDAEIEEADREADNESDDDSDEELAQEHSRELNELYYEKTMHTMEVLMS